MTADEMRQHVRDQLGSVQSQLEVRRAHPSYGITKAALRHDLARAEGMLALLAVEDGRALHVFAGLDDAEPPTAWLRGLREDIEAS